MVTCHLRYVVHPARLADFETYARRWITLVRKFGGIHHGYLLPSEGASDVALASFSFPSLADYERYRLAAAEDAECQAVLQFALDTQCFRRCDRSFFRPVFDGLPEDPPPA